MTDKGTNLDPWYDSYADRTAGLSASEVRALFAVASRPEVVSLAGGMPYLAALPMDSLATDVAELIATEGQHAVTPCVTDLHVVVRFTRQIGRGPGHVVLGVTGCPGMIGSRMVRHEVQH